MKITGFNPLIATKEAESAIALFETLGFEKSHKKEGIGEQYMTTIRLKDTNGFHVDVAAADYPQDVMIIRINVDDFDEALKFFTDRGFFDPLGNEIHSGSSRDAILVAPSGFPIRLIQHLK